MQGCLFECELQRSAAGGGAVDADDDMARERTVGTTAAATGHDDRNSGVGGDAVHRTDPPDQVCPGRRTEDDEIRVPSGVEQECRRADRFGAYRHAMATEPHAGLGDRPGERRIDDLE